MNKILAVLGLALIVNGSVNALERSPLGNEEAARWGATHRIIITESDLTDTSTVIRATITGATIRANTAIEPVALVLAHPFNINSAATNAYNTLTVTVGDTNSATQFVSSTELNENGTEVYFKWATPASMAAVTTQLVYLGSTSNVLTNAVLVSSSQAATEIGRKYYTVADKLLFAFTGLTNQTLDAFDRGEIQFYYRELRTGP